MWNAVGYNLSRVVALGRGKSTNKTSTYRTAISFSHLDGSTRFPKLEECAHFHYGVVSFKQLQLNVCEDDSDTETDKCHHNDNNDREHLYLIEVTSDRKKWIVCRTYVDFCVFDHQLHKCIYDRKFSQLPELSRDEENTKSDQELLELLGQYLRQFSDLATCDINCGPILNWLEIDNLGNRILSAEKSGINIPAVAAAHVIKRYYSRAADEISLEVGDVVSVIDKLPPDETVWWRGKKDFEVGFFPSECVEMIGDTVPPFVASRILQPSAKKIHSLPWRKKRLFGCDLAEYLLRSGHVVPPILKSCADVVESHGIVNSIYRQSGTKSNIQKLRLEFDEGSVPDLTCYRSDIHSISCVLQMYFRELPNPLLTYQLYDKFIDVVKDEENMLMKVHDVVQQLPLPHYRTAEYLMRHLARMAEHERKTDMKFRNLAFIWAPILLRSEKVVKVDDIADAIKAVNNQNAVIECLINHCSIIFNMKMKSQKKPNPKLLGILASKFLLSIEQARRRHYFVNPLVLDPNQTYIDLPTCLDNSLPNCSGNSTQKGSLKERWKTFFSKSHANSVLNHGFSDTQQQLALNRNNNNCSVVKLTVLVEIYLSIMSSSNKYN